jgi:hypothetical protein
MTNPSVGAFQKTRRLLIKWQLMGTASVLGILAIGFFAFAADLWLTGYIGPPAAAAATGGLLVLTSLAVVGIKAIVTACDPKAVPPGRNLDASNIAEMAGVLVDLSQKLDSELRASIKPLTIVALIIGCAVGYSPFLQRKLKDLIG